MPKQRVKAEITHNFRNQDFVNGEIKCMTGVTNICSIKFVCARLSKIDFKNAFVLAPGC